MARDTPPQPPCRIATSWTLTCNISQSLLNSPAHSSPPSLELYLSIYRTQKVQRATLQSCTGGSGHSPSKPTLGSCLPCHLGELHADSTTVEITAIVRVHSIPRSLTVRIRNFSLAAFVNLAELNVAGR